MLSAPDDRVETQRPSAYGLFLVGVVSLQAFAAFLDGNASQITEPGRVLVYALATTGLSVLVLWLAVRWSGSKDRDRVALVVAPDADPPDDRKLLGGLLAWLLLTVMLDGYARPDVVQAVVGYDHKVTWQDDPGDWTPREPTLSCSSTEGSRCPSVTSAPSTS
jgi:hypothetical protein